MSALSGSLQAQAGSQTPTGKLLKAAAVAGRGYGGAGVTSAGFFSAPKPPQHLCNQPHSPAPACAHLLPAQTPPRTCPQGISCSQGCFPRGKPSPALAAQVTPCSSPRREQDLPENYTMGSEEEGINKGIPLFVYVCELLGGSSSHLHHPPSPCTLGHSREQLPPQVGMLRDGKAGAAQGAAEFHVGEQLRAEVSVPSCAAGLGLLVREIPAFCQGFATAPGCLIRNTHDFHEAKVN